MLEISSQLSIADDEIKLEAIRSQGAGGQNVNKVSTAIHLRFDIQASSLPEHLKERLLALNDRRITADGIVVIKAQRSRSQDKNRQDALARLAALIREQMAPRPVRKKTKPTAGSIRKRLENKNKRSQRKQQRRPPGLE